MTTIARHMRVATALAVAVFATTTALPTAAAHAAETGRTIVSRDAKARFADLPTVIAIDA